MHNLSKTNVYFLNLNWNIQLTRPIAIHTFYCYALYTKNYYHWISNSPMKYYCNYIVRLYSKIYHVQGVTCYNLVILQFYMLSWYHAALHNCDLMLVSWYIYLACSSDRDSKSKLILNPWPTFKLIRNILTYSKSKLGL